MRAKMECSASSCSGSYECINERRSRNNPRMRSRLPTKQRQLEALPYSGAGLSQIFGAFFESNLAAAGETSSGTE